MHKLVSLGMVLACAAPSMVFAADYVYHSSSSDACANGLTLTFSTAAQANILNQYSQPVYQCTDLEPPQAPDDSGCRASKVIGQTIGFKVQLGTLTYSNNLGQKSSGEFDIVVYADLLDGSGGTIDGLTYQLDDQFNSLDMPASNWGDATDETEGMPLDNLPSAGGVHKVGNQFPALVGYADRVLSPDHSITVFVPNCPNRITVTR